MSGNRSGVSILLISLGVLLACRLAQTQSMIDMTLNQACALRDMWPRYAQIIGCIRNNVDPSLRAIHEECLDEMNLRFDNDMQFVEAICTMGNQTAMDLWDCQRRKMEERMVPFNTSDIVTRVIMPCVTSNSTPSTSMMMQS